jgi:branched-chain amino acid transport system ATP-binding protein
MTVLNPIVELRDIGKSFGGIRAVNDISLDIGEKQIYSLIGPNGAGKTTLMNLMSAMFKPSQGTIKFDGHNLHKAPTHKLAGWGVSRTFQNLAVFSHASVIDNLLVGLHHRLKANIFSAAMYWGGARNEEKEALRQAEEIIDFLEIEHLRDQPAGMLSYGLQKRVELGRALATKPKLLLLDEMVSGMNAEETEDIARFIMDIRDELGITVVMVEHDMAIVMDISDRVAVLNHGILIADGTPEEIKKSPAVIEAYLGRN